MSWKFLTFHKNAYPTDFALDSHWAGLSVYQNKAYISGENEENKTFYEIYEIRRDGWVRVGYGYYNYWGGVSHPHTSTEFKLETPKKLKFRVFDYLKNSYVYEIPVSDSGDWIRGGSHYGGKSSFFSYEQDGGYFCVAEENSIKFKEFLHSQGPPFGSTYTDDLVSAYAGIFKKIWLGVYYNNRYYSYEEAYPEGAGTGFCSRYKNKIYFYVTYEDFSSSNFHGAKYSFDLNSKSFTKLFSYTHPRFIEIWVTPINASSYPKRLELKLTFDSYTRLFSYQIFEDSKLVYESENQYLNFLQYTYYSSHLALYKDQKLYFAVIGFDPQAGYRKYYIFELVGESQIKSVSSRFFPRESVKLI